MRTNVKPAYYNEIDPYAAERLRRSIAAGIIAPGDVDQRSIRDVQPSDLRGYGQCHFFAGIGVWSYALRRAGWDDAREVWTGSCPCQPFSHAGSGRGFADDRHLWPDFHRLIRECQPAAVFGEQVASPDGLAWLDSVQADLESSGYAVGTADLCSAGVGAPNIRQRLYWVGYSLGARLEGYAGHGHGAAGWTQPGGPATASGSAGRLADADSHGRPQERRRIDAAGRDGADGGDGATEIAPESGAPDGFWSAADWTLCRDGRWRPIEPGTFPLAASYPERADHLRVIGNAINAEVATTFIAAAMEA